MNSEDLIKRYIKKSEENDFILPMNFLSSKSYLVSVKNEKLKYTVTKGKTIGEIHFSISNNDFAIMSTARKLGTNSKKKIVCRINLIESRTPNSKTLDHRLKTIAILQLLSFYSIKSKTSLIKKFLKGQGGMSLDFSASSDALIEKLDFFTQDCLLINDNNVLNEKQKESINKEILLNTNKLKRNFKTVFKNEEHNKWLKEVEEFMILNYKI